MAAAGAAVTPLPGSPRAGGAAGAAGVNGLLRVPQDVPTLEEAMARVADGGIVELAGATYPAPQSGFKISNAGKSFTVRAAARATVVLDGGGAHPVLVLRNSSRSRGGLVVFQDLVFRNGGGGSPSTAAGVTVDAGEARFVGCRFESNAATAGADGGGAKVRNGSDAAFIGCSFSGNSSPLAGGAVMVDVSSVEVIGGAFTDNHTNVENHDPASHGGAINVIDGTLRVSDALFQGNQAGWVGGAIYAFGDWTGNPGAPSSYVSITRSTFQDNAIAPRPCCTPPGPPTGGAIHVEDQTTLDVRDSYFTGNAAQFGGAVDTYRAVVDVAGSTFLGNRGDVGGGTESIGGAISAGSNDFLDPVTASGRNPRPAAVTVTSSLLAGNPAGGGPVANTGGCIQAGGDENHLYGLAGLSPNGTPESNRAQVAISGSVLDHCDVQQGPGGGGTGGAVNGALVALSMDDSLVLDSSAAGNGSGGGIFLTDESAARISHTTFAGNSADAAGGGVFAAASDVRIDGSRFIANQVGAGAAAPINTSRGAALYSIPARGGQRHVGPGDASGLVAGTSFSQNLGLPVWDVDFGGPSPVNTVQYNANAFSSTSYGDKVYIDTFADPGRGGINVGELNSLVVSRSGGPTTVKAAAANQALWAPPAAGSLKAMPASGSPGARSAPFLAYAWTGQAATLDGAPLAQHAGLIEGAAPGNHVLVVDGVAVDSAGIAAPQCTSDPMLCLSGDRFRVQVQWELPTGERGEGHPVALSGDTGTFWFFSPAAVELIVKVLDGRALNGSFWVFYGALSDVRYTLVVTDTATGEVRAYVNPQGHLASSADTSAFPSMGGVPPVPEAASPPGSEVTAPRAPDAASPPEPEVTAPRVPLAASLPPTEAASATAPEVTAPPALPDASCAAGPGDLCLGGRFRVSVAWRTATGAGAGTAVPLTGDTGYFWFFSPANVELVVKIVDGRAVNNHFWVFYGALSDVQYTITVADTQTGRTRTYRNPQGTMASAADTSALPGP